MRNLLKSVLDARKLLPFAFILMLAFLVAMAWDGYSRARELLSSEAFVEHTHAVLHEMDGLEDGIQDAREAALHYVLTPEKEDLDTFERSAARIWKELEKVSALTKDDPSHQVKITQLHGWIEEELQQMRDNLRTQHTLLIFHSKESDFKRNRVGDGIQAFKDEEERLLSERTQAAQVHAQEIIRSVIIRIVGFSALMAVLFLLVIR